MDPISETPPNAKARLLGLDRAVRSKLKRSGPSRASADSERQLTRLLEIAKAMNRIQDHDQLLAYVSERLRELFDAQNSFVILFDADGKPVIQSSHMEGPTRGQMPVSQTLLERVRLSREPVIIDDAAQHLELRSRSSIEELRIASALCAPLIIDDEVIGILQFDQRGDPQPFPETDLRLLSLFADQVATALHSLRLVTEVKNALAETRDAQAKLVAAERLSALGEMAGGVAHNFNNTLFVALGLCDVVLAKRDLSDDVRGAVERIRTCSLDAAGTVRRLKSFSRGNSGEEQDSTVHPAKVAADLPELTRHKWHDEALERGVEIEMRMHVHATPPVSASAAELREILTNLIFNAVDAMRDDGAITVTTGQLEERVFLEVRDEGVGMDESVRRQIFEPFFTTKGTRGSGFGLSTCWSIVHCLNGEISVKSEPGKGSSFTIWLPTARDVIPAVHELPKSSSSGAQIVVVDDDRAVRETIVEMTELLGHQVSSFPSGELALEAILQEEFDLLISDVGMPGMSGNDLARRVIAERPELPIVLLTGWGAEVELDSEVSSRVSKILSKPITLAGLRESLNEALSKAETAK